jgi:pimeloyl-ACP methyl ester carboxylesterase
MKSTEFHLSRGKNRIKAWLYSRENATGFFPAVIICHGIPGSKPDPQDHGYIPMVEEIVSHDYACILFNFTGCGESGGNIDMLDWYEDLDTVYDMVHDTLGFDPSSIHCVGFSAGGAIASKTACLDSHFKSLLLMATPADFSEIIPSDPINLRDHFRNLGLIREEKFPRNIDTWYRNFRDLKPIRWMPFISPRPVGIVHGENDTVVPVGHAHKLFNAAFAPKKLTILEGAPHQLRKDPRTTQLIIDWLREVT